jgi:hypothetical protein
VSPALGGRSSELRNSEPPVRKPQGRALEPRRCDIAGEFRSGSRGSDRLSFAKTFIGTQVCGFQPIKGGQTGSGRSESRGGWGARSAQCLASGLSTAQAGRDELLTKRFSRAPRIIAAKHFRVILCELGKRSRGSAKDPLHGVVDDGRRSSRALVRREGE